MWLEIILFVVLLLVYAVVKDGRPSDCPPGPTEIPFFGGMPIMTEQEVENLRKDYGDIVMYRSGNTRFVYLYNADVAKEVMARPEFVNRPAFFSLFNLDDQKLGGVVFSNGVHWQHDRRFVLRNLRNLGMGKSYLEEAINIEAKALVEDLKKYEGEAINFPDSFRTAALNIIWQMVASTRFDLRSAEVNAVYKITRDVQSEFSVVTLLPMFVPALNYLPKFIKDAVFKDQSLKDFFEASKEVVLKAIDEHLEHHDPDNVRDLIDEYVKGMKESEGDEDSLFRKGALVQIVNDLFQAGSDTVNNTLKWAAVLLARYPDYARRMQRQIDGVVPRDRMVSLDDKPRLPLTEAFITETLRYSSMVILNVERTAAVDTTIGGYFIPKETVVQIANYSVHHDPRYWEEPHKFCPERFLDDTQTKFTAPKRAFFPFGSGRRQCVGELLARMELFLFTAAVAQNFDVFPAEGVDLTRNETQNLAGLLVPADKKLVYKFRE